MALNQYDETVEQLEGQNPPRPPNPYAATVDSLFGQQESEIDRARSQASETTPQRQAEILDLSRRLGIPAEAVRRNVDVMRSRAPANEVSAAQIQRETPALATWLTDQNNAALAQDDLEPLGQVERVLGADPMTFGTAFTRGIDKLQMLGFGSVEFAGDVLGVDALQGVGRRGRQRNLAEIEAAGPAMSPLEVAGLGDAVQFLKETAGDQIPVMGTVIAAGLTGAAVGSVVPVIGTTLGGLLGAFAGSLGLGIGEVQGGVRERAGEDDLTSRELLSVFVGGTAIAALDSILPGKIGGQLRRLFGREAAEVIALRTLASEVAPGFIRRTVTGFVSGVAIEGVTEALQEAIGEVAVAVGTKTPISAGLPRQMLEAGITGAVIGGPVGGVTSAASRRSQVRRAKDGADALVALGDAVQQSKTAERSPGAVQTLIAEAVKDGPRETTYLPVDTFTEYFQGKGLDPAEVAASLTGDPDALLTATRTGEDLAIPTAVYATQIALTEHNAFFTQEARLLGPEEMNGREAAEFEAAQIAAEADLGPAGPETASIRDDIQGKLEAAGFDASGAESIATLYETAFRTLGARAGVDPVALAESYRLQITREGITGSDVVPSGQRRGDATDAPAGVPSPRSVAESTGPVSESASRTESRRTAHLDDVFGAALANAQDIDPTIDPDVLRRDFDDRVSFVEEQQEFDDTAVRRSLLEAIAVNGGISLAAEEGGGFAGELRIIRDSPALKPGGHFGGVARVFRRRRAGGSGTTQGHSIDRMLELLRQDQQFSDIETPNDLLNILDVISRADPDAGGVTIPGTRELGMQPGIAWWRDVGDTSFEFEQGPVDDLQARRLRLPANLQGDINLLAEEQAWLRAVTTPGSGVRLQDGTVGVVVRGATDPVNGVGQEGMALVAHEFEGQPVERWYQATQLSPSEVELTLPNAQELSDQIAAAEGAQVAELPFALEQEPVVTDKEAAKREKQRVLFQPDTSHRGAHRAPQRDNGAPGHAVNQDIYPDDIYSSLNEAVRFYGTGRLESGDNPLDRQAIRAIHAMRGKPDKRVTVYRAVPAFVEDINPGDWVTTVRAYAEEHSAARDPGVFHILSIEVRAGDIFTEGNSIFEWGWDPADRPAEFFQPANDGFPNGTGTSGPNRGRIRFGENREVRIDLLQNADLSTFLHETGHFYLQILTDLTADLPAEGRTATQQQLADDLQIALSWLGVENESQIGTDEHEVWARSFEAYLREGKAPSAELRAAFARFRAWLVSIYRSIRQLHVELTPEIRGVMDRLVATDEAIATAQAEAEVTPLFTTAETAGMSPEAFATYQDTVRAASTTAQEDLQGRLLREQQRALTAERVAVEAEVAAEIHQAPAYRALSAIQHGTQPDGSPLVEGEDTTPLKLEKAKIIAIAGERVLPELRRRRVYSAEGGQDPAQIAEMFGFETGDALIQALRVLPPMTDAITVETDQRMQQQFGGAFFDGTLPEAAQAAVSGEHRQTIVRAELAALTKAMASRVIPPAAVINEAARTRIAGMRVRDIRPGLYLQAARRASQRAFDLVASGEDRAGAVQAKQQELISLSLFREATRVKDEVDRRVRWVRDHDTATARARTAKSGTLEQWDALLAQYEFSVQTLRALDRRQSLREWARQQEAAGLPVDLPEEVLDATTRVNFKELTVEAFTGVTDTLRQLLHLSRLKNRLLRQSEKRTLAELAGELATSIARFSTGRPPTPLERSPADLPRQATENFFAWQRKLASLVRQMDGGQDNGPVWQAIMLPLNEASNREQVLREEATQSFVEMLEGFSTDDLVDMSIKRAFPAIGESISRAGRIVVALNWGNAMNRQRLMDGRGWSTEQVQAVLSSLDANDWTFVQAVWTQVNSYWPEIAAKQTRVYGVAPDKVEATPFETSFGTMPGGYFPIKFDPNDDKSYADSVKDIADAMSRGASTIATTRRGHTKARLEKVNRPIWIDLNVIWQHSAEVIHDLTHHEALSDVTRILRHKTVSAAIKQHQGIAVYRAMQGAVTDIAAGTIPVEHHGERAMGWLLAGTSIARMGWNVMTSLVQPLGLTVSMVRVGPRWVGRGIAEWLGDATRMENTVTRVHAESSFMASRHRTLIREIAEIKGRIRPRGSWALASVGGKVAGKAGARVGFAAASKYALVEDTYFYFISRAQMIADIPTYLGAKQKALEGGVTEHRAIALADQAVIDSQGTGLIKDLAQAQRGTPALKIWTQFMGYFSVVFNQGAEAMKRRGQRNDPISRARLAADLLLLYTVPMVLESALRDAVRGEEDDDESLLVKLAKEQLSYIMATVVFARELTGAIEGFRYGGPAGSGFFDESTRLLVQLNQGELDVGLLKAVNQVGGILFHYPATEVERLARAVIAAGEDPSEAFSALFGGRPEN